MLLLTVILMQILAGAEIDLFVPSFPEIEEYFEIDHNNVTLTISVNLIFHCVFACIAGNLSDKYGRKKILNDTLIIFILGSLICVCSQEFYQLLIGRALQGIGISGPAVVAYLVIADKYKAKKQRDIMGLMNGTVVLGMAFAPIIGAISNIYLGWRGSFAALLSFGIIVWILNLLFIPNDKVSKELKPHTPFSEYLKLMKNKKVMYYICAICFLVQPYWLFISFSSMLYRDGFNVSLQHFGFYQSILALTFALMSITSGFTVKLLGEKRAMRWSFKLVYLYALWLLCMLWSGYYTPNLITASLMLLAVAMVVPFNTLWPMALMSAPNAKGKISGMLISGRLILTALNIQIVAIWFDSTFYHLGLFMGIALMIGLFFALRIVKSDNLC